MDEYMARREASMRPRPLCEEERDAYFGGAPERSACAWCGEIEWIDDGMSGCCSVECLRHHNGDHTG